ncbi:uncharacterized protein TRIADDRAFT_33791 [Trichoplax adhaerens]|uniref:Caffeoyl-CoA O-methyltransferase n=1 Tax=Trichoplax adhaerens TaxID=10228 RepID=B3SD99_TRIAD|nr:hypothetical protein TRIADDRAFT_33791 [Trichoplax adhaerens]EDV19305.1 hypothetical protein TRIADDRAFT_33791 [Trichoplax adhaerens]|eukprot:XP_002118229.1 hypothetical protein TRIADDRAFT_33791 [Trichoplax adhaerens]
MGRPIGFPTESPIYQYVLKYGFRKHPVLQRLCDKSAGHPEAIMAATSDEVSMMQFLLQLIHAKKVLEVGVFTGYTTLGMALALPSDGKVIGLDISKEFVDIGRPFWKEAGVDGKIDIRLGPAVESMDQLLGDNESGTFDFIFIDADKTNYVDYYEKSLQLLRKDGMIAIDNTLWRGYVADESINDADTTMVRQLNSIIKDDERVEFVMLTVADGVTLVRKK